MVHDAEVVVGVGVPWPVDLQRAGRLTPIGVAQICRDAAVLCLELLDRVEGRIVLQAGNRGVQSPASDEHQWKAGAGFLEMYADSAFFVKGHGNASLSGLLCKSGAAATTVAAAPEVRMLRLIWSTIGSYRSLSGLGQYQRQRSRVKRGGAHRSPFARIRGGTRPLLAEGRNRAPARS